MASPRETALMAEQYYHVALPRNVPGRETKNLFEVEAALLERLITAVKMLTPVVPLEHQTIMDALRLSLLTSKALNVEGKIDKTLFVKALGDLARDQALIVHATEQNAAVLVYRQSSTSELVFEAFEASASSADVCAAEDALLWDFPGQAVSLRHSVYTDSSFQESLATFLEQCSIESVKQFSAVTYKAAAPLPEVRDTTDPALVTGLLMGILRSIGRDHPVHTLRKRIRDTVSFLEAHKPWRRSPFYLISRVTMQRHLYRLLGAETGRFYYKIIMCISISLLLEESLDTIAHEDSFFLKQKLGRRLAKLASECYASPGPTSSIHASLFQALHSKFDKVLTAVNNRLEEHWNLFKRKTQRIVRPLPFYAADSDLMMQLPLSGHHLTRILSGPSNINRTPLQSPVDLIRQHEQSIKNAKPFRTVIDRCITTSRFEQTKVGKFKDRSSFSDPEASCCALANTIHTYMSDFGEVFDGYSELKSLFILNVMELWVEMDRQAIQCYPLLDRYQPGFRPAVLDALELLPLKDMIRVQRVQTYLRHRSLVGAERSTKSIFASPAEDTFAVRYFDMSPELQQLRSRIDEEAAITRDQKEKEWRELSEKHRNLMKLIAESTCAYITTRTPAGLLIQEHVKGCIKHRYKWQAKQITIKILENPLPESEVSAKAVVFELQCPKTFAAYRDATWIILAAFASRSSEALDKVPILQDYVPLRRYARCEDTNVTLGSSTKSHLDSHYTETGFPVALHHVCRPCGLKFDYFDQNSKTWTKPEEVTSVSWHLPIKLSPESPYRSLRISDVNWPSSNQIIASQTKCPPDLNIHEFMAWQGLLSGTYSRWLCLLREMGATNLNFSSESSWSIITKLILQVGPSQNAAVLRDVHSVFQDPTFCEKLLELVSYRLEAVRRNWREHLQIDILISILLKTSSLSTMPSSRDMALRLLSQCREVTWNWCMLLGSYENNGSKETALSAAWAAVLCKRTFQGAKDIRRELCSPMLKYFVGASIALQENLDGDPGEMPWSLRSLVLKDVVFTYQNREIIQQSILANQPAFLACLDDLWPVPLDSLAEKPFVEALSEGWWMQVAMRSRRWNGTDFVHYDMLHGDLLINGKQAGILPAQYRKHSIIERIFGTRNLRVRPSFEPGMSLFVARRMPHGHHIHLGLREGKLIIRATQLVNAQQKETMELIDSRYFYNNSLNDLPTPLIENCWHWLNVNTGVMEIRQDNIWKSKDGNWKLDFRTRSVYRRSSRLVDPQSRLAVQVAQNFTFFEHARNIIVYQPRKPRNLSVELKRLELNFYVNRNQLLECRQLKAEIVLSHMQDAGVWYGLKSKIVLHSVTNQRQRSILVPTGVFTNRKHAQHVLTTIGNDGSYLKYDINDVLGRVECAAEPRLLYFKAYLHACTSYFIPDSLTGRTGKDEALDFLQSGICMPWTYLGGKVMEILIDIAKLTPSHVFYPPTLRNMESVSWNPNLTITIQDDRYRAVVEQIYNRSEDLRLFETKSDVGNSLQCPHGNPHLERRGIARSDLASPSCPAYRYEARDGPKRNIECVNVEQISRLLADWSSEIPLTPDLAAVLQTYPLIGGYLGEFQRVQLFDLITADLGENWGSLVFSATQAGPEDRYRLIFLFASIAFSSGANMALLRTLVSYALLPELKEIPHPNFPSYVYFQKDEVLTIEAMVELMKPARIPYNHVSQDPDQKKQVGQLALKRIEHEQNSLDACVKLATSIRLLWPSNELNQENMPDVEENLVNKEQALDKVLPEYTRLANNYIFSEYLATVQVVLKRHDVKRTLDGSAYVDRPEPRPPGLLSHYPKQHQYAVPTLQSLLGKSMARISNRISDRQQPVRILDEKTNIGIADPVKSADLISSAKKQKIASQMRNTELSSDIQELRRIARGLRASASPMQDTYTSELEQSINSLVKLRAQPPLYIPPYNATELQSQIRAAETRCNVMYYQICQAVEGDGRHVIWLKHAYLWPRMTKPLLLSQLNSRLEVEFGEQVKEVLVLFGTQITELQRLLRIHDAASKGKTQQLNDEIGNSGHNNWLPLDRPDWLLLEIDSNIMLRAEQIEVANATITPSSGKNSVVQLLMGKGKTSCILPMVAAVLANSFNLLRIIVPRPLLLQSAQVMHTKLGALLNREIIHIPFSRKTPTNIQLMGKYFAMHSNLRRNRGVVLTLPEHILSYKLSGMQRLCDDRLEEGTKMIKFQNWLDRYARDVLDECDVSLAIRTQLIYPSGSQLSVDGHPLRWQTVQAIIRVVQLYLPVLEIQFPRSIEVVYRSDGGFPLIYLLREDVQKYLVGRLVQDICNGQLSFLPCAEIPLSGQEDIQEFISNAVVPARVSRKIEELFKDKQHLLKVLYHLRGLFVHRILLSSLKKRWNVQYGLHPDRDPIAVPYLAKGVPSPSSEWGHPDMAIILTCLSFYYQGLSLKQFKQAFEQLMKSDEPSIEYEKWTTKDLPENLRDFNSINAEDSSQLMELHYHVRLNVYLLDFFLNNFVFPKHAKQFSVKLQASGWDLILADSSVTSKCRTTGFSGTNDSRHQLPLTIEQNDQLTKLSHTNAEVLSYLLASRNRKCIVAVNENGKRLNEINLLKKLKKVGIRILIDAGAQILEHNNIDLARAWLSIDLEASSAVYFDDFHRPWVLYRKGKGIPLVASPFADNLEDCVVYLDESHCRGTDLKLPPQARAALTLGPHVTKDTLAQAAMRLRLLGQTQAVTFFAPPEVHQGILDMRDSMHRLLPNNKNKYEIDSRDVIAWLLKQSCNAIEHLEPLYCMQGNTYLQHMQARTDNPKYLEVAQQRTRYLSIMQSKEVQTLKELYEPKRLDRGPSNGGMTYSSALRNFAKILKRRKHDFQDQGLAVHSSALEEVEQEREVEHEVENVREVQIPVHFDPLKVSKLHEDILLFLHLGFVKRDSRAYQPIFSALHETALGTKYGASFRVPSTTPMLLITTQYRRTVKVVEPNDNFIRPCHWLLLNRITGRALALSPEEADAVIPLLRLETDSCTHLIVYSAPVTRRMLHFNNLDYHATPPLPASFVPSAQLRFELGIFAGRLYFDWSEYDDLCSCLGISRTMEDGYAQESSFSTKPLTFLHEWLAVLRKGQDFEHTPMGFLTTGKPLSPDHPFFHVDEKNDLEIPAPVVTTDSNAHPIDDDSDDDDRDDDEMFQQNNAPHQNGEIEDNDKASDFDEEGNEFFDADEEQVNSVEADAGSEVNEADD